MTLSMSLIFPEKFSDDVVRKAVVLQFWWALTQKAHHDVDYVYDGASSCFVLCDVIAEPACFYTESR